jgi:hypothetical protein
MTGGPLARHVINLSRCREHLVEVRAILAAELLDQQHATWAQHPSDLGSDQAAMAVQDRVD